MIRPTSLILLALSAAAGGALFHVSFEVSGLEDRLARLNRQITADREAIHVLRAEWSFLNQPGRIEELSRRYLDLVPLTGEQFVSPDAVPVRLGETEPDFERAGAPVSRIVPVATGPADTGPIEAGPVAAPRAKPAPPVQHAAAADTRARPMEDDRTLDDVLREITSEGPP